MFHSWTVGVNRLKPHNRRSIQWQKAKNVKKPLQIDSSKAYSVEKYRISKETNFAKFDASVEVAYRLGLDPKKADQQLRTIGASRTGKTQRVLVFAKVKKAKEVETSWCRLR